MNFIGPYSIEELVETRPWLRDVILRDRIRTWLSAKESADIALARNIHVRTIPLLEREARLNMSRYGMPYNPLRPGLLRTSVEIRQLVQWLAGELR